MKKAKKNNVVNFPSNLTSGEREVEAILFAAAEPLNVDTIEEKISKKINVPKILEKLQTIYSSRGINLVCISKKWSFRTAKNLSNLMSQQKSIDKKVDRKWTDKDVSKSVESRRAKALEKRLKAEKPKARFDEDFEFEQKYYANKSQTDPNHSSHRSIVPLENFRTIYGPCKIFV